MGFTHVLVAMDFSESADRALRCATEEAALHHAKLTLLHVLSPHARTDVYYVTGSPESSPPTGLDPVTAGCPAVSPPSRPVILRRDPSEEVLEQLRDRVPSAFHHPCDVAVADGEPADTIVRVAQERRVDLIVMGTRGRTGLQHVLLGSVAERVVRLARCPVLVVRPRAATR